MRKFMVLLISLISVLFVISPSMAFADGSVKFVPSSTDVNNISGCSGVSGSAVCEDIKVTTNPLFGPDGILTKVAGIFGVITGVISVFMMLIGGVRYITSSGDPQKAATARKTIIYAAVGVVVASIGGILVRFLLSRLS